MKNAHVEAEKNIKNVVCLVPKLLLGNAYSYGNLVKRDRVDLLEHWYYFDTEIRVVF